MSPRALAKGAAFAAGTAAGIAAAAWATQRLAARNIRRAPDADASRVLDTPIYVDCHLDTPDRGTIHVVESGEGPPIMLSHGVTLLGRLFDEGAVAHAGLALERALAVTGERPPGF